MKIVFRITIAVDFLLIAMSIYPGRIESVVFSLVGVITLLPLLGAWFLFVGFTA